MGTEDYVDSSCLLDSESIRSMDDTCGLVWDKTLPDLGLDRDDPGIDRGIDDLLVVLDLDLVLHESSRLRVHVCALFLYP